MPPGEIDVAVTLYIPDFGIPRTVCISLRRMGQRPWYCCISAREKVSISHDRLHCDARK